DGGQHENKTVPGVVGANEDWIKNQSGYSCNSYDQSGSDHQYKFWSGMSSPVACFHSRSFLVMARTKQTARKQQSFRTVTPRPLNNAGSSNGGQTSDFLNNNFFYTTPIRTKNWNLADTVYQENGLVFRLSITVLVITSRSLVMQTCAGGAIQRNHAINIWRPII
ncbi:hypothetical protein HPG69_008848, partial [Diceros bicornis minor]